MGSSTTELNETEHGVAALPSWVFGINATYAARDKLNSAPRNFTHFGQYASGSDKTTTASLGADYMFTPHFGLTGTAQSTWLNSSVSPLL